VCPHFKSFDICKLIQMCGRVLSKEQLGGITVSDFNAIAEDQKTG